MTRAATTSHIASPAAHLNLSEYRAHSVFDTAGSFESKFDKLCENQSTHLVDISDIQASPKQNTAPNKLHIA